MREEKEEEEEDEEEDEEEEEEKGEEDELRSNGVARSPAAFLTFVCV